MKPSDFTPDQRRTLVAEFHADHQATGVSRKSWARAKGLHVLTFQSWITRARSPRSAKPLNNADCWATAGTLIALLGMIGKQAVDDVDYGIRQGWLTADLRWQTPQLTAAQRRALTFSQVRPTPMAVLRARTFLLSEDGQVLCSLINALVGKQTLTPAGLLQLAKRQAANPSERARRATFGERSVAA